MYKKYLSRGYRNLNKMVTDPKILGDSTECITEIPILPSKNTRHRTIFSTVNLVLVYRTYFSITFFTDLAQLPQRIITVDTNKLDFSRWLLL